MGLQIDDGCQMNALLKEYETMNVLHNEMHKQYTKMLFGIAIGFSAISVFILKALTESCVENIGAVLGISAIFLVLLSHMWLSGWAYTNLELWSVRNYLKLVESKIRENITEICSEKSSFQYFSSDIMGMYNVSSTIKFDLLNLSFMIALSFVYFCLLFLSCVYGFPTIAKYLFIEGVSKNYVIIFGILSSILFLAISLLLFLKTLKAKTSIDNNFHKIILEYSSKQKC